MPSLADLLLDNQFRADLAANAGQAASGAKRGVLSGLLGAPVDLMAMLMRPLGYRHETPMGGSEWFGNKMENAGILPPRQDTTPYKAGEALGPLLTMKAPDATQAMLRAGVSVVDAAAQAQSPVTRALLPGVLQLSVAENILGNGSGLTREQQREALSRQAEKFADPLRKKGFEVTIEQSGSAAGPSFYASVFDPTTNRYIKDPARFSFHGKGAHQSQFSYDMNTTPFEDIYKLADSLRKPK